MKSTHFLVNKTYQESDYLCLNLIYIVVKTELTFLEKTRVYILEEGFNPVGNHLKRILILSNILCG